MKRSDFIRNSTIAAAGIGTLLTQSCNNKPAEAKEKPTAATATDNFELNEITITELQEKMAAGKYTSAQITELYLQRIAQMDKAGPMLNAVIELNPDAMTIAKQMDDERKAGKIRSPLHGIPVLIKDNIGTADKMKTTAGSLALADAPTPKHDAFLVQQLRKAGDNFGQN